MGYGAVAGAGTTAVLGTSLLAATGFNAAAWVVGGVALVLGGLIALRLTGRRDTLS